MRKLAIGLSAAALAFAGTAYAAHGEGRLGPDANGDSTVTRAEHQAHAEAMFKKLDANGDGQLDQADRELRRQEMRSKIFARLDTDSNGSISRDEFMAFEGPGEDHRGMGGHGWGADGMPPHEMGGPGDEDSGMHHRWGQRGHGGDMMMKMMQMADTNGDGKISQAEFGAAADKRFDAIDTNHDGQITKEERQAHRQEMRAKWHDRSES